MGQSKTKVDIIACGLDNSGKTTILNFFRPDSEKTETVSATIGYNVESFQFQNFNYRTNDYNYKSENNSTSFDKKVQFTAFDMGGAKKFRALWESYYSTVQGIIFVIDSADVLRLCVVKDELEALLRHPDLNSDAQRKRVPILVFANKNDLDGAKTPAELTELLELPALMGDRPYNIFSSDARKGVALAEGMGWLQETVLLQLAEQKRKSKQEGK